MSLPHFNRGTFQALARQLTSSADVRRVPRVHKLKGPSRPPLGRLRPGFES